MARVLAWITPAEPYGHTVESPVDHAAQSVHMAVCDFFVAIQQAQTAGEALTLVTTLTTLALELNAAQDAALLKADQMCGAAAKEQ